MLYAADGTLLRKEDGKMSTLNVPSSFTRDAYSLHITSNGNYLGEVARTKKVNDNTPVRFTDTLMAQHGAGMSQSEGSGVQSYQTQSGDTLASIALAFYGSSDYWYLIANRNGLSSTREAPIAAGQTLEVPSRATQVNSANSFKPMQLEQIIGDTTPGLPQLPPPPKCNAIAMIVMIAITVVATIATAGAAALAAPGAVMSTGMSALAGGLGWAGAGAAAAGGFVGSVAGQLAGKAMGVVESFSLRNAFASAFTAGATAGMGHLMGVGGQAAGKFTEIAKEGAKATLDTYGKMAMAASSVGFNVAANKLAGNNNVSFSWRNVVTSAATAGAMDYLGITDTQSSWGKATNDLGFTADVLNGFAGAAVGYGVGKALYNKGGWNFRDVATDVFGNALGNAVVKRVTDYQEERFRETEKLSQNMAEIDARNASGLAVDGLLDTFGKIDQEIADNIHDDFYGELFVATQLNDQLAGIASDKNANAIFKYNAMSAQTHKDIAAIEQRSRQSAQKRAEQSEILRARQQEKFIDFRMDNPVYRAPEGFSQFNRDVDSLIELNLERKARKYSRLGLEANAAEGDLGDLLLWTGARVVNEVYQGGQFTVKALLNGLTLGMANDTFSPLDSQYHSLIGKDAFFGTPTTYAGAVGNEFGEVVSFGTVLVDPSKAAKAVATKLKSLNSVERAKPFTGNQSHITDGEFDITHELKKSGEGVAGSVVPNRKIIDLKPGQKGGWNKTLNTQLDSNTDYKVGSYTYETDSVGNVNRVHGSLELKARDRNTYQQTKSAEFNGIKDGLKSDDGGHLVASIFNGPGEQINYLPMNLNLNRGRWKKMENTWAEALKSGKKVSIDIKPIYEGASKRPAAFDVKYWIDGKQKKVYFENMHVGDNT